MVKKRKLKHDFFRPFLMMVASVALVFLCAGQKAYSETIRPHASEAGGWTKDDIGILTGYTNDAWKDKSKIVWRSSTNYGGVPGETDVLRCEPNGDALVWADVTGVHFFQKNEGKIITPINLSSFNFKQGPEFDYKLYSDSSVSYFYIQWNDLKITEKVFKKNEKKFLAEKLILLF